MAVEVSMSATRNACTNRCIRAEARLALADLYGHEGPVALSIPLKPRAAAVDGAEAEAAEAEAEPAAE